MLASLIHWRLLVATILALMAAAWLIPAIVPPPKIQENRILAKAPAWPLHLKDVGHFREGADAYVVDNFPSRRHLIGLLNRVRILVGVSGSERVIVGRDGWLFYDDDSHLGAARDAPPMPAAEARAWLDVLGGRTAATEAAGARYVVVLAPNKETIYPQYAPVWFGGVSPARPAATLPEMAAQAAVGDILALGPAIEAATQAGQQTYSRHDTHWTGYGAYAGYARLLQHLYERGLTEGPRPLSDFPRRDLPALKGPRDLALMLGVASFVDLESAHFTNPAGEARLRRTFLGPRRDWTGPQVIDTGEVGKPVLLMTRDSFSNELLPFMYSHFSRIILTHNQDGFWRPDLIARFKPDIVMLQVVESRLRVAMEDGPAPPAALATPVLEATTNQTATLLGGAAPTSNCNLETVTLTSQPGGQSMLAVAGWISEPRPSMTSPTGYLRLSGPAGDFAAPIMVNGQRSDVAAYFNTPAAAESGFSGGYRHSRLPAGAYTVSVYRQASNGWIVCASKQPLTAP